MEKSFKKAVYISLFVFLGIELQFLVYFLIEAGHIALMNNDFQKYSLGMSLDWWLSAYSMGAIVFFFLGALFGFFQGQHWWEIIYEKYGENDFRPRRLLKREGLRLEKVFGNIGKKYFEVNNFKLDSGQIDNICVGPTGIFTIEIKENRGILAYYDGHLLVEGRKMKDDFVGEAKKEADFLSALISKKFGKRYFVVPMIIFPNADVDESMNFRKDDVWIGDKGFQNYVIKKSNYFVPKEDVLKIVEFLKKEKTKYKKDEK
ncbi:MAG: nuclease-related domain-containing protein [Candidatus Paceibacterota bacterium]|jgi:hypothetical protein